MGLLDGLDWTNSPRFAPGAGAMSNALMCAVLVPSFWFPYLLGVLLGDVRTDIVRALLHPQGVT